MARKISPRKFLILLGALTALTSLHSPAMAEQDWGGKLGVIAILRKTFLVIFVIILLAPAAAHARDVLVIQGLRVKPYDEAFRGFRSSCDAGMKRLFLPDLEGTDIVRLVREEKPRLILAIGADALKKVRKVKDVPIVYLMVVNPQTIVKQNRNITGVAMNVSPERFLDLLSKVSPRPKTVGVIYDPAKTGHLVRKAQQAARKRGIEIAAREVGTPREVLEALNGMKGKVDALWMLPDTTVVTPETVELFLLVSQENRIPVIGFAAKYVEMGVLAALDIDGFDQGRQAGEMAAGIMNGTAVADLPGADARRATVKVNRTVAKKLGITLDDPVRHNPGGKDRSEGIEFRFSLLRTQDSPTGLEVSLEAESLQNS